MFNSSIQQFNIGGAQVYVATFDDSVAVQPVAPAARQRLIEQTADIHLKRQRYCVWRLLDYALRQTLGKGVDELSFDVDGNGRWHCGEICFSLSHSGNAVAVAVCQRNVGIDIEAFCQARFNARLAHRILTEREHALYNALPASERPRLLAEYWTKKESVFKCCGGAAFVASAIDTADTEIFSKIIVLDCVEYVVAVATA